MISKQEALKELAKRELAKREFRYFIDYTYNGYVFGEWHDHFFNNIKRVVNGECKRLIVQMPPRVGKTELISKRLPAFLLGNNPKLNIIGASYGADLATKNGRETRRIVQSKEFKNIFNKFSISDEKKESGNWETSENGGYYTVGVGGAVTGFGGDYLIIDDYFKNREDAESATMRDKLWDWYTSTFYTRKQGDHTAIIVLATRWHEDDLIGRLLRLQEEGGDKWEVISYPALDNNDNSFYPERFSSDYYKNERKNIGIRDFSALYQQDPILSMSNIFKKETFRYFAISDFEHNLNRNDFIVRVFCDPAFSTRQNSDDLVVWTLAQHKQTKDIYLLDGIADIMPPSMGAKYIVNVAQKFKQQGWSVDMISVEDVPLNKQQTLFINQVDEEMRSLGVVFKLNRYCPKIKKEDRIKFNLERYFDRNAIFFRTDEIGNNIWRKLEEQLLRFPTNDKDDIIDCLAQGIEVFEKNNTINKEEEESYQRKIKEIKNQIRTFRPNVNNLTTTHI